MAEIINFPQQEKPAAPKKLQAPPVEAKRSSSGKWQAVVYAVWIVTALVWPILKWVISLDCVFQGVRMIYHWHTPGMYLGWTFLLHFAVLSALTYFVALYKPKDIQKK